MRILLVEDNPADADLIIRFCRTYGKRPSSIHRSKDGQAALDFLHRLGDYGEAQRPDVVILDLTLPKKDGREVMREMLGERDLASIPVVVLTTSNRDADRAASRALRARGFFTKPSTLDEFESLIKRLITEDLPRLAKPA